MRHKPARCLADAYTNKLFSKGERLDRFFKVNVGIKPYQVGKGKPKQNRSDVDLRRFDSDTKLNSRYRQYLRGADIESFLIAPQKLRYIKYGDWLAEPRPAADFNAEAKIFVRQTGDSLIAAKDLTKLLCLNNMHVIVPMTNNVGVDFLLGLLNSTLMNWFYHTLNPEIGEALAEVKKENVARLPIVQPMSNALLGNKIASLAGSVADSKQKFRYEKDEQARSIAHRRFTNASKELNQCIYALYELTESDIALIEADEKGTRKS